ncbi:MAG: adenine deaminase [Treponema sp.]|nr:adenine deaminase [Treponema sp.]
MKVFEGKIVDVVKREVYGGKLFVEDGRIKKIERCQTAERKYLVPGFVNSHIHIESSMVTPQYFALESLKHGVVAAVADPHEITNVCGAAGFDFMLKDAARSPMKIYFAVPSCVPATKFETSGAVLDAAAVARLLKNKQVVSLGEMMNFPGVLSGDKEVMAKIAAAKKLGKPVDGHAPMLSGEALKKYAAAGISTDHESASYEEGLEKVQCGMFVQIREGSAAKNLKALAPLFKVAPEKLMFCVDDLHPSDLAKGYLWEMVRKLIADGYDSFDVMRAATYNPVKHYKLDLGLLQEGDSADFIVVSGIKKLKIEKVVVNGQIVVSGSRSYFKPASTKGINNFNRKKITVDDIAIRSDTAQVRTIKAIDKEVFTESALMYASLENEYLKSNLKTDVLKLVCVNRYNPDAKPAVAFVNGFGLKAGALASSVAHDSHNIICVGTDDKYIVKCINKIIRNKGGLAVANRVRVHDIPLNVAGLMTSRLCQKVVREYADISYWARMMGCKLNAPYMTLSFLALTVIPKLKITDLGLFDSERMEFVNRVQ